MKFLFFLGCVFFFIAFTAHSEGGLEVPNDSILFVRSVQIHGNHRTRERIILRELALKPGDTIRRQELTEKLAWDQRKLNNTNLFITVDVTAKEVPMTGISSQEIDIEINMKERWYLFIVPVLDLADRNFNEWWYERGRDLRRTIYGARVSYRNITGNADRLSANVEFGFAKRIQLIYSLPYIDQIQKTGLSVGFSYQTNKEVAYRSAFDKLVYLRGERLLRDRLSTSITFSRRQHFYGFHYLDVGYSRNWIADTVARLNPGYFLKGQTKQRYFQVSYNFIYDRRDAIAYPLRGYLFNAQITKYGLLPSDDLHILELRMRLNRFWPLGRRLYSGVGLSGKASVPSQQPYLNFRGMGYIQDVVRGYELYVVDGQHYILWKNDLKYQLFNIRKKIDWIPIRQFNTIPLAVYLGLFGDIGRVSNSLAQKYESQLANTWLYGGGIGLDVVTFYNIVARLTYSINRQGQTGVFVSFAYNL